MLELIGVIKRWLNHLSMIDSSTEQCVKKLDKFYRWTNMPSSSITNG